MPNPDSVNKDSFDQWLDTAMQNRCGYLDDDGFSTSILQQLPTKPKLSSWQQNLIIFISCLIGCGIAASLISPLWLTELAAIKTLSWPMIIGLGSGLLLLGSAIVWNDREHWI